MPKCNTDLCQVVANNLMAAVYNDHVDNAENDSLIVTTFRIGCAVPPLLWALLFKDFASIVGYAGQPKQGTNDTPLCILLVRQQQYCFRFFFCWYCRKKGSNVAIEI